ncbi:hypothetical protein [Spirosoma rhododendri]|uniref:Uncharacterized protein n=1 Tax=Spirosoma rhododendri TaxID=2728024 RepID=A0A7L5DKU1_9BACT|nr:hypothetical protein [Spirosoma rhododendri]QJD78705.1 hypothetical protein HH216_09895 [Spirosoma rhododendri]
MSTNPPLSNLQMSLLKLYASQVSDEDLLAINQRIVDYFAEKASQAADAVWDERGYSDELMTQWLTTDFRKGRAE